MAEISLRSYLEYIEDRLERDAYSEVIAQCRHILGIYPKHVETYVLLARALTGQENQQDALDLFQRVLSADPNHFVAHIGMSECYLESEAIEQAIWHLERAFEQAPSNLDLQEEIKRLYVKRDGKAPRKIQLTSSALARLYNKGKLYPQAILELEKAITNDPERLDLQVLLAEALWHNHQEVLAGKVAAQVLKRLPYSIDANRILAQLWLKAGQHKEARPFLDRVKELDPYRGYEVENRGQSPPSDAFRLTMLDYRPEAHAAQVGAADWVAEIGAIEKQEGVTGPLRPPELASPGTEETPDWLQQVFAEEPAAPDEPTPDLADLLAATPDETPVPSPPTQPEEAPSTGSDAPSWLQDVLSEPPDESPAASTTEAPDWLADVLGEASASAPAQPESIPLLPAEGDAPDWLQDVLVETGPTAAPEELVVAQPAADVPDWLQDVVETQPVTLTEADRVTPSPADEAPEWLADIMDEEPAAVAGTPVPEFGGEQEAPAWLDEMLADSPVPPAEAEVESTPAPSEESAVGRMPDWLKTELEEASAAAREAEAVEEPKEEEPEVGMIPPDWLQTETEDAPRLDEEPIARGPEALPDWLQQEPVLAVPSMGTEDSVEAESIEEEALPDWLQESAVAEGATPALQEEMQVVPPTDEDIPDWLAEGDLDSDDALAWLEEIAAKYDPDFKKSGEEEEAEEAAEVAPPEPAVSDEVEEPPEWLQPEAPVAPTPEPVAKAPEPTMAEEEEEIPDWLKSEEPVGAPAAAKEPEDELDWLRTPTEEVAPAIEAEEEEKLPAWLLDEEEEREKEAIPVEAEALSGDEALAWLDKEVAEQGVSPEEIVSEVLKPDQPPVPASPIPAPDAEAEPVSADELPAWLRDVEAQQEIARALEAPGEPSDEFDIPELEIEEEELAWLDDALKAEEAAAGELGDLLKEIDEEEARPAVPVAEKPEEEELPAWLIGEEEPAAAVPPAPAVPPPPPPEPVAEEAEEEELPAWLVGEEEPAVAAPPVHAAPPPSPEPVAEEAEEEELPAWLVGEEKPAAEVPLPAPEPVVEEPAVAPPVPPSPAPAEEAPLPAWLQVPAEPVDAGLDEFLKAAEPAGVAPPEPSPVAETPPPAPEPTPPPAPPVPSPAVPEAISIKPTSLLPEYQREADVVAQDFDTWLNSARQNLATGDINSAVSAYETLVRSGQMLDEAIADLQNLIATKAVTEGVYRVLGDALVARGNLDEGLKMYQKALDQF